MSSYRSVIYTRRLFVAFQVIALACFVWLFIHRSDHAPRAVATLPAGHVLVAADLEFDGQGQVVGKALVAPVQAGARIGPGQVKDKPAALGAAGTEATLAAVVRADKRAGLDVGAPVLVRRQAWPDVPGRILSSDCARQPCTFSVLLLNLPASQPLDLQTFSAAELLPRPAGAGS